MARCFSHVLNDVSTIIDKDGLDLSNLQAACKHARKVVGDILAEELQGQNNAIHLSVLIEDPDHVRVANLKCVTTVVEFTSPFDE
ncbi:DUF6894 family protein [Sphingomonas glacialis]|uniref:DUF6894 domain-containing protein n=1 Tax=Sphingomonas glacialis TaxID=658225 RepID=A0A502FRF6_9SPHN|nr:hypothetical protein EAH76_14645 [Sphingomonas glacialis]